MSSNRLYVVVRDGGHDGFGPPLRAFSSLRSAEFYRAGARDGYGSQLVIFAMPVDDVVDAPEQQP